MSAMSNDIPTLRRISELTGTLAKAAAHAHLIRYADRWPLECAELRKLAGEIRKYGPDHARLGYRLARVIEALHECYAQPTRKQMEALSKSFRKFEEAVRSLRERRLNVNGI